MGYPGMNGLTWLNCCQIWQMRENFTHWFRSERMSNKKFNINGTVFVYLYPKTFSGVDFISFLFCINSLFYAPTLHVVKHMRFIDIITPL